MTAPATAKPPCRTAGSVPVHLAGWTGWLAADTPSGTAELRRRFRIYGASAEAPPARPGPSGVHVSFRAACPRLACWSRGDRVDPLALLNGPEWKRLRPRPSDRPAAAADEYEDTEVGPGPALRRHAAGLEVLRPEHWSLYVQLALLGLVLRERPVFTLHAATCAYRGTALVLVGPSGAGKSTLCCALQQAGAQYYGDELAFFSLPEYSLWPLPHHLALRPGGVGALGLGPQPDGWYEHRAGDPKRVLRVPEPECPCPAESVRLFLLGGFAAQPELRGVGGGEALRRLLRGMGAREAEIGARLELLAGLVERYPCRELRLGRPAETAARLLAEVEAER